MENMLKPISSTIIKGVHIKYIVVNITIHTHGCLSIHSGLLQLYHSTWNYFTMRIEFERENVCDSIDYMNFIHFKNDNDKRCQTLSVNSEECAHICVCVSVFTVFHGKMNASCIKYFIITMIKLFAANISFNLVEISLSLALSLSRSLSVFWAYRIELESKHTYAKPDDMAERKILNRYLYKIYAWNGYTYSQMLLIVPSPHRKYVCTSVDFAAKKRWYLCSKLNAYTYFVMCNKSKVT